MACENDSDFPDQTRHIIYNVYNYFICETREFDKESADNLDKIKDRAAKAMGISTTTLNDVIDEYDKITKESDKPTSSTFRKFWPDKKGKKASESKKIEITVQPEPLNEEEEMSSDDTTEDDDDNMEETQNIKPISNIKQEPIEDDESIVNKSMWIEVEPIATPKIEKVEIKCEPIE